MKLYGYWRSTTSYRVRAALNLKGRTYETIAVDLVAGDQREDSYRALNPGQGVPTLELDDGTVLTQSMAILDYIDTAWPEPRLIPADPLQRAKMLAVAHSVALDVHPINNLRVVDQLKLRFGASADQAQEWAVHWMAEGFAATEAMVSDDAPFATGGALSVADLCIVAQVYSARRWGLSLDEYPNIARIEENCLAVPEVFAAHPDQQPEPKGTV